MHAHAHACPHPQYCGHLRNAPDLHCACRSRHLCRSCAAVHAAACVRRSRRLGGQAADELSGMPSDGECSLSQQCGGMSISGDEAKQAMNSVACLLSVNAVCSQQSEPGCGMCSSDECTCMQDYRAADWAAGQRYWAVHTSLDGSTLVLLTSTTTPLPHFPTPAGRREQLQPLHAWPAVVGGVPTGLGVLAARSRAGQLPVSFHPRWGRSGWRAHAGPHSPAGLQRARVSGAGRGAAHGAMITEGCLVGVRSPCAFCQSLR